tara:strand:- start:237 stop:1763 length:1527 start_codon:yes stop_codon:yes gene_type:complete
MSLKNIKINISQGLFGSGKNLGGVLQSLSRSFQQKGAPLRQAMDTKQQVVTNFDKLMREYEGSVSTYEKISWGLLKALSQSTEWKGGTYSQLEGTIEKVFGKGFMSDKVFDHTDYQPSLVNVALLYKNLAVWIKESENTINLEKRRAQGKPVPNQSKVKTILLTDGGQDTIYLPIVPLVKTIGQLKELKKRVGAVMQALQTTNALPIKAPPSPGNRGASYDHAFEQLAQDVNAVATKYTEVDLLLQADMITDVLKTGSVIKGRIVSKEFNTWLGHIEGSLSGVARDAAQKAGFISSTSRNPINKRLQKQFIDKIDWTKVQWSKSQEESIVEQLALTAAGKKYKKVKKSPKGRGKLNTTKITGNVRKNNVAQKVRKNRSKSKSLSAHLKKPFNVKKQKRESGEGLVELTKLEGLINKRLPAEVRRNMGRPALRNQTGRFSNSVELQSLRPTAKGISGEYTYQVSPYETFENTGARRWPTGYNPKPLIAKSIRNLAMQYTEQKLVSLRRT